MENHSIAELLTTGQVPSQEERVHLTEMGEFAAGLFARHMAGASSLDVTRVDFSNEWATNLSHGLSASTADRWANGMGTMLADMLGHGWGAHWNAAGGRAGYSGLDVSSILKVIELVDEESGAPVTDVADGGAPVRRGSLFGPRTSRQQISRQQQQVRRVGGKEGATVRLSDGSRMALAVVEALEAAGLPVSDQLAPELPDAKQLASVDSLVFDRAGRPSRLGGVDPVRDVSFDGLTIGDRTPALASALRWAEAAYGDLNTRFGPSSSRRRMLETVQGVSARQALAAEPAARPVFGFFDSVEGDFLALTPEVEAQTPTTQSPAEASRASAQGSLFGNRSGDGRPAFRHTVQGQKLASMTKLTRPATLASSLSRIVPQSVEGSALRPLGDTEFTSPAFGVADAADLSESNEAPVVAATMLRGEGAARVAVRRRSERGGVKAGSVTYRPDGRPQARVQRSAVSAPRFSADVAGKAKSQWRLAADAGADMPLGATLTSAEMLAGTVSRRRQASLSTSGADSFRSMAARTGERPAATLDSALPGVSWVAMAQAESSGLHPVVESVGIPMATQPVERNASMVPASLALELASPSFSMSAKGAAGSGGGLERGMAGQRLGGAGLSDSPLTSRVPAGLTTTAALGRTLRELGLVSTPLLSESSEALASEQPLEAIAQPGFASSMAQYASDATARFGTRPMVRFGRGERTLLAPMATDSRRSLRAENAAADGRAESSQSISAVSLFDTPTLGRPGRSNPISHVQPGEAPSPGALATLRQGRRALQRPVTTARESLAVQRMLTGGAEGHTQASTPTAGTGQADTVLSEAVRALGGVLGASEASAMPSLVRVLAQRQATGSLSYDGSVGGVSLGPDFTDAVVGLKALPVTRRQEVARQLRLAGFSTPELAMLSLDDKSVAASSEAASQIEGQLGMSPSGAHVSDAALGSAVTATVTRAARNLARVLTGTEAMASRLVRVASPERPVVGGGQAVAAALSGINTVLETVGSEYFGALAPERVRAASPSLRAAIGDLLTLAKEAAISVPSAERFIAAGGGEAGQSVPSEAQPRLMEQLATIEAMVANAETPLLRALENHGGSSELAPESATGGLGAAVEGPAVGYQRMASQTSSGTRQFIEGRLESRLAGALDASTAGPAGADRLMGRLGTTLTPLAESRPESSILGRNAESAAIRQPLSMAQVLAPEAMLGGMSGPELQAPVARPDVGNSRYTAAPGELMGLVADSATNDRQAGEPEAEAGSEGVGALSRAAAFAAMTPVQRLGEVLARRGASDGGSLGTRRGNLLQAGELVVSGREQVGTSAEQGTGPTEGRSAVPANGPLASLLASVDAMGGRTADSPALGRLMGRLNRKESIRTGGDAAVREFAVSWMRRVDGTMSGVDVGLAGEASELRRFFGVKDTKQVDSAMSAKSPMKSADLVAPTPSSNRGGTADRSGMEGVARAAASAPQGGAERAAKAALSSLNWNYVKTGSGASTTNANLSGLASTAASSGAAGSRVAFPLVAPAVKAVAQTALRSARSESMEPGGGRVEGVSGDAGPGADAEAAPKLTRQALQKLAKTLAGPVSKILKRDQEDRRGKWA